MPAAAASRPNPTRHGVHPPHRPLLLSTVPTPPPFPGAGGTPPGPLDGKSFWGQPRFPTSTRPPSRAAAPQQPAAGTPRLSAAPENGEGEPRGAWTSGPRCPPCPKHSAGPTWPSPPAMAARRAKPAPREREGGAGKGREGPRAGASRQPKLMQPEAAPQSRANGSGGQHRAGLSTAEWSRAGKKRDGDAGV